MEKEQLKAMINLGRKEQIEEGVKLDLMMDLVKKTSRFIGSLSDYSTSKEVLTSQITDIYSTLYLLVLALEIDSDEVHKRLNIWMEDMQKFSGTLD